MNALAHSATNEPMTKLGINERVDSLDWNQIGKALDGQGHALLSGLLTPEETRSLSNLYSDDRVFRSRVVMARHGFGRGEYKYFDYPLPNLIGALRTALYTKLGPVANQWNTMNIDVQYPDEHVAFIQRCHDAAKPSRRLCFCNTLQMISTACIRTFTVSMCFQFRWRSCSPNPKRISRAANSSLPNKGHACSHGPK
jgi:Oxygenase, catalysing oxidative methylation of damaged DNA